MQAFGELGEGLLEGVLTAAGLARGTHYQVQAQLEGDDQEALRPDVIVNLPDGKHLVIDAKANLKSYNFAVTAEDKQVRRQYMEAHVSDILARVRELQRKHYDKLKSVKSPDFVLMYIPFEQAYMAALEVRPTLVEDAIRQKVAIVTNSTLLATLRTVSYVWTLDLQQRNAELIAKQGGKMLDKIINFAEDLEKVRKAAGVCQQQAENAWSKLVGGPGNLKSHALKLAKLGVKGKKPLEGPIFETHEDDEVAEGELEQVAET
jgi:DNA recombination protein RmuC